MWSIRRYALTYIGWWLLSTLCILTPFFFLFWLFQHDWWGQTLFFVSLGIGLLLLFRTVFSWSRNVFVITTHRLVDIEQRGIFDQVISEVPYDQIDDVSGRIKGVFGTLFRYGTVTVQTGGGTVHIVATSIRDPLRVQQQINELRERYVSKYAYDFSENVAEKIIDKLYELELPELHKVKDSLEKRIRKLGGGSSL